MAEYKFLDDLAKFGNTTMTAMGSLQKQVGRWVSEQTTTIIQNMDLVTKNEVENYKRAADSAQERVSELESRIKKLEEQFGSKPKKDKK